MSGFGAGAGATWLGSSVAATGHTGGDRSWWGGIDKPPAVVVGNTDRGCSTRDQDLAQPEYSYRLGARPLFAGVNLVNGGVIAQSAFASRAVCVACAALSTQRHGHTQIRIHWPPMAGLPCSRSPHGLAGG